MSQAIIGLDIGHSTVKGVVHRIGVSGKPEIRQFIFPSVAVRAVAIADEATAAAAERETVMVGGVGWFFGDTAVRQSGGGGAVSGLTNNWIHTDEYAALFLGALRKLSDMGVHGLNQAMYVVGLPSEVVMQQREPLKAVLSLLKPLDEGGEYKVAAQPVGAFNSAMLDETGAARSHSKEQWGLIDVGYYTTDFVLYNEGVNVQQGLDSCNGVHAAAKHLSRLLAARKGGALKRDVYECQEILRTGKTRAFGKEIDVSAEVEESKRLLVDEIIDRADTLFGKKVDQFDGVLIAGGGASILYPALHARWSHAQEVEDSRMAVARGFCLMGVRIQAARTVRERMKGA